jgi:hypothetical protein
VGIPGNEKADAQAKRGRTAKNTLKMNLSRSENKSIIKNAVSREWRQAWDNSRKGRHAHSLLKEPSRSCQVKGEHKIPSVKKLLRLGTAVFKLETPFCHNCITHNIIAHFLVDCKVYSSMRSDLADYFLS